LVQAPISDSSSPVATRPPDFQYRCHAGYICHRFHNIHISKRDTSEKQDCVVKPIITAAIHSSFSPPLCRPVKFPSLSDDGSPIPRHNPHTTLLPSIPNKRGHTKRKCSKQLRALRPYSHNPHGSCPAFPPVAPRPCCLEPPAQSRAVPPPNRRLVPGSSKRSCAPASARRLVVNSSNASFF